MFVISQPNLEILDERYFTVFMRWFMLGIDHTPYQLPGLSFIVTPFVYLFGDNWFSWRFPIILFGMVFLYFYYKVIHHITNKKIALLTTIILSVSPMIFTHSSLLLRDIPVMALGFFSIYLYFKQKYYLMGIMLGLTGLIKETAIFFLIFIVSYEILHNRERLIIRFTTGLEKHSISIMKKPIIVLMIIISSFLIPLTVYDNTINVLEYQTVKPELRTWDENGKFMGIRFDITKSNTELYQKSVDDFNYMDKIKDPLHHLQIFLFNGYYSNSSEKESNAFLASFLPIQNTKLLLYASSPTYETIYIKDGIEYNLKVFPYLWVQSMVNYSWWHIGFWSCMILIGYSIFQRVRNKIPISKDVTFIFCGLVFFIPYLIIGMMRDTYVYYIIYFLPIMALGLTCIIYKIPNKTLRFLVFGGFLVVIIGNFLYVFPILR